MPRVTGPLFSVEAHGALANAISFRRRFGYTQVEKIPKHRDARSPAQEAHRAKFLEACSYWHGLTEDEQAFYNYIAHQEHMTGFNYVVKYYLLGELP